MKHVRMPKIPQFRNTIKSITRLCRYECKDEDGTIIYNNNKLPVLGAHGSVKLHGTCASVCYNNADGMWAQSKNQILNSDKDNAGWHLFVVKHHDFLLDMINRAKETHVINTEENTISIFGEWVGKGIQAKVAIAELERKFFIFGIKVTPNNEGESAYWVTSDIFGEFDPAGEVFYIKDFKTFEIEIDFSNTISAEEKFVKLVDEVESECPVAKYFGVSGIGEGIVFTLNYKGEILLFKIKGQKHVGGKRVKQMKSNNVDQQKIDDIVFKITYMRLEQMCNETFDVLNGGEPCIEGMGKFLRLVKQDIIDEDLDIIIDAGLKMKDINKTLHSVAKNYLLEKLGRLR